MTRGSNTENFENWKLQGNPIIRGVSTIFWDIPSGTWPGSHNKNQRKISFVSNREKGNETILKYTKAFCSIQSLTSGEKSKPESNLLVYYQSLADLREGKYPTSVLQMRERKHSNLVHSSHPVPPIYREKQINKNWEYLSSSQSRGIWSLRQIYSWDFRRLLIAPYLTSILTKAYLQQLLLSDTSCSAIKKR